SDTRTAQTTAEFDAHVGTAGGPAGADGMLSTGAHARLRAEHIHQTHTDHPTHDPLGINAINGRTSQLGEIEPSGSDARPPRHAAGDERRPETEIALTDTKDPVQSRAIPRTVALRGDPPDPAWDVHIHETNDLSGEGYFSQRLRSSTGRNIGRVKTAPIWASKGPAGPIGMTFNMREGWALLDVKNVYTKSNLDFKHWKSARAPWSSSRTSPFFVIAEMSGYRVQSFSSGNEVYELAEGEFAEILAGHPEIMAMESRAPIVLLLLVSDATRNPLYDELHIPRVVATWTGKTVFSATGRVELIADGRGEKAALRITRRIIRDDSLPPQNYWAKVLPTDMDSVPTGGEIKALSKSPGIHTRDGIMVPDSEILAFAVVDGAGRPQGRASITPTEWAEVEFRSVRAQAEKKIGQITLGNGQGPHPFGTQKLIKAPWKGDVYFFHAHGNADGVTLAVRNSGSEHVTGTSLGQFLRRRPSVQRLSRDASVVLVSCSTGSPGENGVSVAQLVADELDRTVWAPTTAVFDDLVVIPSPGKRDGEWHSYYPRFTSGVPDVSPLARGDRSGVARAGVLPRLVFPFRSPRPRA
ncbi:hypothetical protein ACWGJX_47600, partial [Streptomyces sp. NPDC054775]